MLLLTITVQQVLAPEHTTTTSPVAVHFNVDFVRHFLILKVGKALNGSNCCYQGRRGARKWNVSVFVVQKVVCCVFFRFACSLSSSIIAFVADTQLCRSAIRTSTPCGARYVARHVQVVLLSFLGPPWSQWCSDWCALGCCAAVAFGCVCEVFAVVPLGVSCFLSCRVGRYFVAQ